MQNSLSPEALIVGSKCTTNRLLARLCPDPLGELAGYSALTDPLAELAVELLERERGGWNARGG